MNIYQAGYTRRGRQGQGAGWSIVAPSVDMSQIARDGFSGIAGNLAELANSRDMQREAYGVFQYDRYMYYLHINYDTSGEEIADSRGVSFTHGYICNLSDYYKLCQEPENFTGLLPETFQTAYDPNVDAFPGVQELPHTGMNHGEIMAKYGFTMESYRQLILGTLCAIEGLGSALCIKVSCSQEEYLNVCREIMYLIFCGLPFQLRTKVTFFSGRGGKTVVFFSDRQEGDNYFDLDAMAGKCDSGVLEKYEFTKMFGITEEDTRQSILRTMAEFTERVFEVPLKEMNCELIRHGFQFCLYRRAGQSIHKEQAAELLASFMGYPLKDCEETDIYLTVLLESMNANNLVVEDRRLLKKITDRAKQSQSETLQAAYRNFYARQIVSGSRQEGFQELLSQYKKDSAQFELLSGYIRDRDRDFYDEFNREVYLPHRLSSLRKILTFLEQEQPEPLELFLQLTEKTLAKEMQEAGDYARLKDVHGLALRVAGRLKRANAEYAGHLKKKANYLFWENFRLEQFRVEQIKEYENYGLREIVTCGAGGKRSENAEDVFVLQKIVKRLYQGADGELIYDIFFTDRFTSSMEVRKTAQKLARKELTRLCDPETAEGVDYSLACYFNLETGCFDALGWIRKLLELSDEGLFDVDTVSRSVRRSAILADGILRRQCMQAFAEELKNKAWKQGLETDREVKRGLVRYSEYLGGGVEKNSPSTKDDPAFSVHRMLTGYLPLFALALYLWGMHRYIGLSLIQSGVMAGIAVIAVLGCIALKIAVNGGWRDYLECIGADMLTMLMAAVLELMLSVLFGLLLWKLPSLQRSNNAWLRTLTIWTAAAVHTAAAIIGIAMVDVEED